ncbi:hypothetical protein [Ferroacidibacillus organovorans]|uniref:Uncharacterized protein n=1 Tax=Ferroacidibacillus organovorans TaxID=1765683 RepID=A0A124IVV0_9BACL|nr:hypothetical protein [Ferroacidibacillus organovorans]KUO95391.1 hypothetical protein ATW55_11090 [Ferroacidibacillus organovorans]
MSTKNSSSNQSVHKDDKKAVHFQAQQQLQFEQQKLQISTTLEQALQDIQQATQSENTQQLPEIQKSLQMAALQTQQLQPPNTPQPQIQQQLEQVQQQITQAAQTLKMIQDLSAHHDSFMK